MNGARFICSSSRIERRPLRRDEDDGGSSNSRHIDLLSVIDALSQHNSVRCVVRRLRSCSSHWVECPTLCAYFRLAYLISYGHGPALLTVLVLANVRVKLIDSVNAYLRQLSCMPAFSENMYFIQSWIEGDLVHFNRSARSLLWVKSIHCIVAKQST